ncbi:Vang 1 [Brachionus plicatilis]|uniref:Vang 1 n=1 Tax=Brachionus plicatilis TaxID=10195 RepID=A0A3M7Q538_BRAPC|nr:Vang 1 [Brachionus plicatilis]
MMFGTVMMSNQTSGRQSSLLAAASKHELSESEFSERTCVYARTKHKHCTREPPLPAMPPPSHSVLNMNEPTYDKPQQDTINVQILPMDDNWGETNTTANTADFSDFNDDMTEDATSSQLNFKHHQHSPNHSTYFNSFFLSVQLYYGLISAVLISASSFVTPVLFVLIPKLTTHWYMTECALECEGTLIAIAFKLFILLLGNWTVFVRRPKSPLPRLNELRAVLIFLLAIITFSYWLFYYVRILDVQLSDYYKILQFTGSYVDVLLFVFIISVFVLELRHLEPRYVIKMVRSPDGQCREYSVGSMSIQKAAVCVLEQYYRDFRAYNPWLEMAHKKRAAQLMQLEQINRRGGAGDNADTESVKSRRSARNHRSSKSMDTNYNLSAGDRLFEEYEYEKRLKKRKTRLFQVTEEAFNLIRRDFNAPGSQDSVNCEKKTLMEPYDAAQAVFTSIARDLRRYLRITRQQPFFSRESIVGHLADCISYDMTPRAFLQRFVQGEPICFNERAMLLNEQRLVSEEGHAGDQTWILVSDLALYQSLDNDVMFVLKQNEVSLMCSVKRLPRFNLIEDILDPKRNKFVLKINSETTV